VQSVVKSLPFFCLLSRLFAYFAVTFFFLSCLGALTLG